MNRRQSVVGFDFQRYNQHYLTLSSTRDTGATGGAAGGANGDATNDGPDIHSRNDALKYGVRIIPAEVAAGQLYWQVIGVRHLDPVENTGKHNLYAELLDENGKRVRDPNIRLARGWEGQRPDETAPLTAFDKGDNEPATNIPIDRNQNLWVRVADTLPSDRVENLHTKHADEVGPNGELWNSIGHHSFYVIFQRTRQVAADTSATATPVVTRPSATTPGTSTSGTTTPPVPSKPVDITSTPVVPSLPTQSADDATYVDGHDAIAPLTIMQPGQRFEQRWQLRNTGNSDWDAGYRLVCVSNKTLGAPSPTATPPCGRGREVTVAVNFVAPTTPGPVHSVWRMVNPRGETFGERLWLVIDVAGATERTADHTAEAAARNVRPVPPVAPTGPIAPSSPPTPTPRLPLLTEADGTPLTLRDPELYAAWKTHIENGFANNQLMFQQLLNGFMNPYWTTVWMYRILFGLGVASFLVAAGLSAFTNKEGYTLVFGGLSALSLLTYFFNRPLQALEENLQFITWLGLIYNSYWTRLVYLNSQPDVQKGLQDATDDAIQRIKELMTAHAKRAGKRETFT